MSKVGKNSYEELYKKKAEDKIASSEYDFLEGFYYYLLTNMAYTTAWNYLFKVIKFLDAEKIKDPANITFTNYVRHMASLKNTSSSNKITSYAALKKFSKYLYGNKIAADDYMRLIDSPNRVETPEQIAKRESGVFSKDDLDEAVKNIEEMTGPEWEKARDMAILKTFMGTGIRRAALLKLDVQDFDFDKGTMTVSEKGDKYRVVYCPPQVNEAVQKWFSYRELMVSDSESAAFISKRKKRICEVQITNIIKKYTGKSPHKLRATYVTEIYDETGDPYIAQEAVGHASVQTTQLYIRGKKDECARKAAEIMTKMMG